VWLLIHIGHHLIQMTMKRLLDIDLVPLVRYSDSCFHFSLYIFLSPIVALALLSDCDLLLIFSLLLSHDDVIGSFENIFLYLIVEVG